MLFKQLCFAYSKAFQNAFMYLKRENRLLCEYSVNKFFSLNANIYYTIFLFSKLSWKSAFCNWILLEPKETKAFKKNKIMLSSFIGRTKNFIVYYLGLKCSHPLAL